MSIVDWVSGSSDECQRASGSGGGAGSLGGVVTA
jgi:hypothetical protein